VPSAFITQMTPGLFEFGARHIYAMWPRNEDALGEDEVVGLTPDAWGLWLDTGDGFWATGKLHALASNATMPRTPPIWACIKLLRPANSVDLNCPHRKVVSRRVTTSRKNLRDDPAYLATFRFTPRLARSGEV
jgi:hypothetical protein